MAVVLLGLAGLAWWLLVPTTDPRGPSFAAPPAPGAGSVSVAPSGSVPTGTRGPTPRAGDRTPGEPVPTGPAPAGQPGATATDPDDPPPTAGAPATTTTRAPEPEEPDEPTETTPPAQERTLTSTGGSVRATCPTSSTARLLSWSATKPYKVNDVDEGPGASVMAEFKHGNRFVTMTVTCSGGVPSSDTAED